MLEPSMKDVMIIDSSPAIRDMVSFIANQQGYGILSADNGKKALQTLALKKVAFIITDIDLAAINGIELAKAVRISPLNKDTPIIVLTAQSDAHSVRVAAAAGVNGFLKKPFSMGDLKTKMAALVNRDRQRLALN